MPVLYARIDGAWVPVGGGGGGGPDEVFIGSDDPIADNPNAELWYDTDAVAPVTDDLRWNTAWGVVATGSFIGGANWTLTAGTNVRITNDLSFTSVVGRQYRVVCQIRAVGTIGSPGLNFLINGAPFGTGNDTWATQGAAYGGRMFEGRFTGNGTAHTFWIGGSTTPATSLWLDGIASFYIEDIGPTTAFVPVSLSTGASWGSVNIPNYVFGTTTADWTGSTTVVPWPIGRALNLLVQFTGWANNFTDANSSPVAYRIALSLDSGSTWTYGPQMESTPLSQASPAFINRTPLSAMRQFSGTPIGEVRIKMQAWDAAHSASTSGGQAATIAWWAS